MNEKIIPIGEAAEFLNVSLDTIRRYDKLEILHSVRPGGKVRYFSFGELQRIKTHGIQKTNNGTMAQSNNMLSKKNLSKLTISFLKVIFIVMTFITILFLLLPEQTAKLLSSLADSAYAAAGINRTINFQGKVVNKTPGTNITNGNYDFTFKLYNVASDGTALWTENWTGANQITVTDGIFRANLGSITTFASANIDFNDDSLYLDITFNAETFTTRVRFTAVPYAINAEKVSGLTVTNTTGTLTIANSKTFTVNNTLTLAGTDSTSFTFPTTSGGTVLTSNATSQGVTSAQTSGTVFSLTDSTALSAAIKGASITLSGTGAFDQTGLEFNLSGATGTNLNDIVGTASSWKVSKAGALTVASCTGCGSGSQTPWTQDIDADNFSLTDYGPNLTSRAGLTITSGSSNINLQPAGTATTANVQIGAGGAGSTTPDLLVLDVKSDAESGLAGTNGAMYYNASTNKFRCYQNSAWTDCIGTGGSAVPKESHVIFFTESNETNAIAF